jgi:hypothetical protein
LLGSALNLDNEREESHHPSGVGSLGDLLDGVAHETGERAALLVRDARAAVARASTKGSHALGRHDLAKVVVKGADDRTP